MKKSIIKNISLIFLILVLLTNSAYTQATVQETLNIYVIVAYYSELEDNPLYFTFLDSDVSPYIIDGITMIPLRALIENFGYILDYHEENKNIIIHDISRENELVITIGSTTIIKNGQVDTILHAPIIKNDRTFIPLRYISEFFGKYVKLEKSVDGTNVLIWISPVKLLTNDDVMVEDNDNYDLSDPNDPMPIYELKKEGKTYQGIKVGDKYDAVISLYGEPHMKEFKDGILSRVIYYTGGIPNDDPGSAVSFFFANGLVKHVSVDGRL